MPEAAVEDQCWDNCDIDPTKCTLSGAEVSKECGFSLIPKLTNGKCTKRECAVDCHLKSLVDGTIVKCRVDRREGNKYCISYTLTTRGRDELTVTMNAWSGSNW